MITKYKHIFFDLDRTLWDFDTNSADTLIEILDRYDLRGHVSDEELWIKTYIKYNKYVWKLFDERRILKSDLRQERFNMLFDDFSLDKSIVKEVSDFYTFNSPRKEALMPSVIETLKYLHDKYKLYIITNGFFDVQQVKLRASGIQKYFSKMFTSDKIGAAKPDKRIFEEAVKAVNARKVQSIYIGDNHENDVIGARNFGMDQIWYNHDNIIGSVEATYEIKSFSEIETIL